MTIVLTDFARSRLFPGSDRPTAIKDCTAKAFEAYVNTNQPLKTIRGYAPFCQLLVFQNWTATRCSVVQITAENRHLLHSAYEARNAHELPVLTRWFEGVQAPRANYLLPIVYDRAQLEREGVALTADWGIVGCLYTAAPHEIPMAPITLMRNALGVDEVGSGVALDKDAYRRSVAFWQTHANWR